MAPSTPLRALLVAYNFPPVASAGVARMSKLAKYIGGSGIDATVLTVSNPSVPQQDEKQLEELPASLEIVRARTFEPGYGMKQATWSASAERAPSRRAMLMRAIAQLGKQALQPDPQVLWLPGASAALAKRLWRRDDDVIVVSAPPFSQFALGLLGRVRPGTAIVLDYRDEWSTYRTTYEMMGSLGVRIGDALEPLFLRAAHAVTLATEEFRQNLLERFRFLDPTRVFAIPNGYDVDDLPAGLDTLLPPPPEPREKARFVISYAGTIFKLTACRGFLGAVRRLAERSPDLAQHLEVRFMGRIVDTERDAFAGMDRLGVHIDGFLPRGQVLAALAKSHLVLCLLDDVPGVERIYPGKIFELMALGRPNLVLAPQGALTRLVFAHNAGDVLPPRDEAAIASYLEQKIRLFLDGKYEARVKATGIERYDRRNLAAEFADVIRQAAKWAA